MIPLIDTHVHINFPEFASDLTEIQERWQLNGVQYLIHSCVHPREFSQIKAISDRFKEVYFAVGLHPLDEQLNQKGWQATMGEEILALGARDTKVVAIGETGLDFYKSENAKAQTDAFSAQLNIARKLNLPVIIHCRDGAAQARDLITELNAIHPDRPSRGVMHCWSGTPEETQWFLDLGMYISFSGIITFKNARSVQDSALVVPPDRLLIETDCPFLAPVPWRGKRNEPSYVTAVAAKLAELRNESLENLAHQTTANALRLFDLSKKE